ncbi:cyclic nucleotide-binding domain-containing protein [Marinomonas transparens]|uniref:Cyclic nucleotide-binding domain-containing protein n=1 Tax=Marinomonas transparens TaxID=2795388 RepID=A0A934JLC7_9GAMM|nr:cyclic nucleotide-binding domain-containing protein [Marinomonas transparens]MBJ7536189.1 cyclic nucleotide-binding domain-containing protein [Marinomonas transparens]
METFSVTQCPYDLSLARLKTGSIFGALSDGAIEFLLSEGALEAYRSEEIVFSLGDQADSFYVVLHGSIGLFKQTKDKSTFIPFGEASIEFGDAVGYTTMIALDPRAADARAITTSLLLKVDSYTFGKFHDEFAFDFGILILNLSRDIARKFRLLSDAMAEADLSVKS